MITIDYTLICLFSEWLNSHLHLLKQFRRIKKTNLAKRFNKTSLGQHTTHNTSNAKETPQQAAIASDTKVKRKK